MSYRAGVVFWAGWLLVIFIHLAEAARAPGAVENASHMYIAVNGIGHDPDRDAESGETVFELRVTAGPDPRNPSVDTLVGLELMSGAGWRAANIHVDKQELLAAIHSANP